MNRKRFQVRYTVESRTLIMNLVSTKVSDTEEHTERTKSRCDRIPDPMVQTPRVPENREILCTQGSGTTQGDHGLSTKYETTETYFRQTSTKLS